MIIQSFPTLCILNSVKIWSCMLCPLLISLNCLSIMFLFSKISSLITFFFYSFYIFFHNSVPILVVLPNFFKKHIQEIMVIFPHILYHLCYTVMLSCSALLPLFDSLMASFTSFRGICLITIMVIIFYASVFLFTLILPTSL